jgi:hypothetical protein
MFLGIEHSSKHMGFAVLDKGKIRKVTLLDRERLAKTDENVLDILGLSRDSIDMVGLTYSAADGINAITDLRKIKNLGQRNINHFGFEKPVGGGTKVYKDIEESGVRAVLIPGVHDGLPHMDPYFRHYSSLCTSDKTAITYYAFDHLQKRIPGAKNFITCSVGNTLMATVVRDGELRGGSLWLGGSYGMVDLRVLRLLAAKKLHLKDAFIYNSLFNRMKMDQEKAMKSVRFLDMVADSALQITFSLVPFAGKLDAVFLAGRYTKAEAPVNIAQLIRSRIEKILDVPVVVGGENPGAIGSALIAEKVFNGAGEVLGIPVDA